MAKSVKDNMNIKNGSNGKGVQEIVNAQLGNAPNINEQQAINLASGSAPTQYSFHERLFRNVAGQLGLTKPWTNYSEGWLIDAAITAGLSWNWILKGHA